MPVLCLAAAKCCLHYMSEHIDSRFLNFFGDYRT